MIATASQMSSTRSSWWLENSTVTPAAARSASIALMASMPPGSRPENGSSSTSSRGSCTSATASCARCWLPCERASTLVRPRPDRPRRSIQCRGGPGGVAGAEAVQQGEVLDLVEQLHRRIEAAFLRHVAEGTAGLLVHRLAVPADLARVKGGDAEDGAHRGGLARAVGAKEAEDLPGGDVEGQPVERGDRRRTDGAARRSLALPKTYQSDITYCGWRTRDSRPRRSPIPTAWPDDPGTRRHGPFTTAAQQRITADQAEQQRQHPGDHPRLGGAERQCRPPARREIRARSGPGAARPPPGRGRRGRAAATASRAARASAHSVISDSASHAGREQRRQDGPGGEHRPAARAEQPAQRRVAEVALGGGGAGDGRGQAAEEQGRRDHAGPVPAGDRRARQRRAARRSPPR